MGYCGVYGDQKRLSEGVMFEPGPKFQEGPGYANI